MIDRRASGILLHPTSLPGRWGIGDLGPAAYRFVDFLVGAGQRWWQMLPLGPTGYGNSPYMSFSAFAGNPMLISPEQLVEDGLLVRDDLRRAPRLPSARVHYPRVIEVKRRLLWRSFKRFTSGAAPQHQEAFAEFRESQAGWLHDYALFMALKDAHHGAPWTAWDSELVRRRPAALERHRRALSEQVTFRQYVQYVFRRQWDALRWHCHRKGVRLIGDVPIYVAHDSADVWAHRDLFHLDARGQPSVVAGVPPDYFSATGQRWGNPIYRWDVIAQSGFHWWIDRIRANLALVDWIRLDHFRGFEAYWEVPVTEPDAVKGRWVEGPGAALFEALRQALGELPLIAEDLGVITPEVDALRDQFALPGMRILQVAFGRDPKASSYRPHNHVKNCVVYTATHDHNTTAGWFTAEPGKETTQDAEEIAHERRDVLLYAGTDGREVHWDFIRLALQSVAMLAVVPLQDPLGLGSDHRMNRPGTARGNWEWRVTPRMLDDRVGERLRELTRVADRLPEP